MNDLKLTEEENRLLLNRRAKTFLDQAAKKFQFENPTQDGFDIFAEALADYHACMISAVDKDPTEMERLKKYARHCIDNASEEFVKELDRRDNPILENIQRKLREQEQ